MSRGKLLAIFLIVAGVAGFWLLRPDGPLAARRTAGSLIVVFGDSLVKGVGASPRHDFVSVLADRLGTSIVNAGRSGDTTRSALTRLDRDVLALNPRVVIVVLGGNDILRGTPRAEMFKNLDTIVSRIREQGAAVVLAGISVGFFSDPYGDGYRELATRRSAGLVPDILDDIVGRGDRMHDAIHPNDAGYAIMADRLEPMVRELLN